MKEDIEKEYFQQRTEIKAAEKKTKNMMEQVEQLKAKLKEKDTLLRIAKHKLIEVNRNIKLGNADLAKFDKDPEGVISNN